MRRTEKEPKDEQRAESESNMERVESASNMAEQPMLKKDQSQKGKQLDKQELKPGETNQTEKP